jgi:hypothetical protein
VAFAQRPALYMEDPTRLLGLLIPCAVSVISVALAPRIGRWLAILLVVAALGWILLPLFGGEPIQAHAGRGLIGMSCFYAVMRLLRTSTRRRA